MNPTATAVHRRTRTFSDRIKAARQTTKIGAVKLSATASTMGSSGIAVNQHDIATMNIAALVTWRYRLAERQIRRSTPRVSHGASRISPNRFLRNTI